MSVLDAAQTYHVIPSNDLRPHETDEECWCKPAQDPVCANVIVHNALDEREKYENGERRPS